MPTFLAAASLLGLLWLGLAGCYQQLPSADLWWLLANGRSIVESGHIPSRDPFSWSATGAIWHNDQWLSSWIFYQLYHWGGLSALHLLKSLLLLSTWGVGLATGWQLQAKSSRSALWAGLALTLLWSEGAFFFDVRAYLFTYLGLMLLWRWLLVCTVLPKLALALLFALWANLHGGVSAGLLLLLLAAALGPASLRRDRLLSLGLASLCSCCNPSGIYLLLHPILLLGSPWGRYLNEWQPVWRRPRLFVTCLLHLATWIGLWSYRGITSRERPLAAFGLFCLTGWRHIPLFSVLALPLWICALAKLRTRVPMILALVALATLSLERSPKPPFLLRPFHVLDATQSLESEFFPQAACGFLAQLPQGERLFHPYGMGGYLCFFAHPKFPVCIDGRAVQVYPWEAYRDYLKAAFRPQEFEKFCQRHQIQLVMLFSNPARPEASVRLVEGSTDWQILYADPLVTVFHRRPKL